MLESLVLYVFVLWTSLLSLVVRAKRRLLPLPQPQSIIQVEADASPALALSSASATLTSTPDRATIAIMPAAAAAVAAAPAAPGGASKAPAYPGGIKAYYQAKIEATELTINERTQNLRRLEAQRNALNARGTRLRRENAGEREWADAACRTQCAC